MAVGDPSDDYTPIYTVTICPDSALAKTMPRNECDPENANKEVEVLDADLNVFTTRTWESLRVGDVCRIQSSQYFPADLLMIHSTSPMETAIDMTWYDGERELRLRQLNQVADPAIMTKLGNGTSPGSFNPADTFRRSGTFVVTRPMPTMEKVTVNFIPSDGRDWLCFGSKQFLPFGSRLIMTDYVIGLVLFVGKDTKYELNGGKESAKIRNTASPSKASAPTTTASPKPVQPPVDAYLIERDTNILWSNQFQDVPDDGNCSMTAFWMGLKTLLQYYPHLKLTPYETLPNTSPQFRASALDAIFADPNYITCLENQLQLWLELDAADLMSVVEDFFLLPENLQEYIIMVNQQCQGGGLPADMRILVDKYKEALTTSHIIGGREVFVPLGQLEMETLCELYQVRLQLIKSESVVQMGPLKDLDPRTIPACHILDKNPDCRRVVRLMNVNTNHYVVHLPRSPEF